MSTMDVRLGGRREAANAADRRKKMLLIGLAVVLLGLLGFQLLRMTKSSDASSVAPAASSTVQPAVASTGAVSRPAPTAAASAARLRAIGRMDSNDPFVPLIRANAGSAPTAASRPRARRAVRRAAPARIRRTRPAVRQFLIKPAAPTAAVIKTNGRRQTVGIGQTFTVGDTTFKVAAVTLKAMRLRAIGGAFVGGRHTIKVRKGHAVTLVNTATGIKYSVRFTAGTTAPPTVTQSATQPSQSTVPPAVPSAGTATNTQ